MEKRGSIAGEIQTDGNAFLEACKTNDWTFILKTCQEQDIDVNEITNEKGWTGLHIAAAKGSTNAVKVLLLCGANSKLTAGSFESSELDFSLRGQTALEIAAQRMKNQTFTVLKDFVRDRNLSLSGLSFTQVPALLYHYFPNLLKVSLASNQLRSLPPEMEQLISLLEIDLSENMFSEFPEVLFRISSLQKINLRGNRLTSMPLTGYDAGKALPKLRELVLSNNPLQGLPPSMGQLNLTRLALVDAQPLNVPTQVLSKGTKAVMEYLRMVHDDQVVPWRRVKLCVCGRENVGKTSMVNSFVSGKKLDSDNGLATDGIQVREWISKKNDTVFSIYDLAGQETFLTTHQFFITDRAMYLLCVSCVNPDWSNLNYWLNVVSHLGLFLPPPVVLVGMMADKADKVQLAFIRDKFKELQSQWKMVKSSFIVSSLTMAGIKDLQRFIKQLPKSQRLLSTSVPFSYQSLDTWINNIRGTKKKIADMAEFERIALMCGVKKDNIANAALFLGEVGSLVSFSFGETKQDEVVIFDPEWLADVMSSIVSFKHKWKHGIIKASVLDSIWHKYPRDFRETLQSVMELFEIMYPLPFADDRGEFQFIAPSMLDSSPPAEYETILKNEAELMARAPQNVNIHCREYRFAFLPLGFFSRLIIRLLYFEDSKAAVIWKDGIVLDSNSTSQRAVVTYDAAKYILNIEVRSISRTVDAAPGQRDSSSSVGDNQPIFIMILESVESVLSAFYNKYHELVQRFILCSHCRIERRNETPTQFEYDNMVGIITDSSSEPVVVCPHGHTTVRIENMAPDICFANIPIIHGLRKEGKLGEGGFGIVYKGSIPASDDDTDEGTFEVSLDSISSHSTNPSATSGGGGGGSDDTIEGALRRATRSGSIWQATPGGGGGGGGSDDAIEVAMLRRATRSGSVWQPTKVMRRRRVAVKELKYVAQGGVQKFQEFQHEVNIMSQLNHPNLVKLFGVTIQPLCMVMEFLPYSDLSHLLHDKSKELSWRYRQRVALDIAQGMSHLQSQNPPLCHRDLRSPNVFMVSLDESAPLVAKVADFGLAQHVSGKLEEMLFTWQWLAPEVIRAGQAAYDERSDIYSYGIVCWELAARDNPYNEFEEFIVRKENAVRITSKGEKVNVGTVEELQEQKVKKAILERDLRPTIPDHTPDNFAQLIRDCWQKNQAQRPLFPEICSVLATELDIPVKSVKSSSSSLTFTRKASTKDQLWASGNSADKTISASRGHSSFVDELLPPPHQLTVTVVAYSEPFVWCGTKQGRVIVLKSTGKAVNKVSGHKGAICAITPDVNGCWTGDVTGTIINWTISSKQSVSKRAVLTNHHSKPIAAIAVIADTTPKYVWSCDTSGLVVPWTEQKSENSFQAPSDVVAMHVWRSSAHSGSISSGSRPVKTLTLRHESKKSATRVLLATRSGKILAYDAWKSDDNGVPKMDWTWTCPSGEIAGFEVEDNLAVVAASHQILTLGLLDRKIERSVSHAQSLKCSKVEPFAPHHVVCTFENQVIVLDTLTLQVVLSTSLDAVNIATVAALSQHDLCVVGVDNSIHLLVKK